MLKSGLEYTVNDPEYRFEIAEHVLCYVAKHPNAKRRLTNDDWKSICHEVYEKLKITPHVSTKSGMLRALTRYDLIYNYDSDAYVQGGGKELSAYGFEIAAKIENGKRLLDLLPEEARHRIREQKINGYTFNDAPTWNMVVSTDSVVGAYLRSKRDEKNITVIDLARLLRESGHKEYSTEYYNQVEMGRKKISITVFVSMCDIFEIVDKERMKFAAIVEK